MPDIKHIWFDVGGTIAIRTPEYKRLHDELRYSLYARVTGRCVDDSLKTDFDRLYKKLGTNSAVYDSLGLHPGFWVRSLDELDFTRAYEPTCGVRETLASLSQVLPISIFTNELPVGLANTLLAIDLEPSWFTHIITGDQVSASKPALDGFMRVIEMSNCPPENILYVGDRDDADIRPAAKVGMQTALVWGRSDVADHCYMHLADLLDAVMASTVSRARSALIVR